MRSILNLLSSGTKYSLSSDNSEDSSDDSSELDMRLRSTSTPSHSTVINRTTKSSLIDSSANGLTNNHKANNLNTNLNLNKSNTSNAYDERDNTPR